MHRLINNKYIKKGLAQAQIITKHRAKTFYFASHFLPVEKRYAAYSVYAICRLSDDTVDDVKDANGLLSLRNLKEKIASVYNNIKLNDNVLAAFKNTINTYNIPKYCFDELIKGMYMDLSKNRYDKFDELYTYCYRAAGVVGLIMLKIFGYSNPEAEKYAVDLGIAMQLTNILRDIKEDYERGRIYLPKDEMASFRVSENQIAKGEVDEKFIALLKFQIKRARSYYKNSNKGIKMIHNLSARLVVCMMKDMYAGILNHIENNNYDVFSQRAHVNITGKTNIALKVLLKGEFV